MEGAGESMKIRTVDTPDGERYVHRGDVIAALRSIGQDYLQHVPSHAAAGEFLECILDRHADFILGHTADFFEGGIVDGA